MLDASARLMVEPLKAACAATMAAQLSPDNALEVWRIAEAFSLLALEKVAVDSALGGFEELPPQLASGSQVLALVQEERLTAKNEEAVFVWIARWWEAAERPEAELMAVLKHLRFATMAEGFLRDTVRAWPALLSVEGQDVLHASLAPVLGGVQLLPRLGFGPRRIYLVGGYECDGEEVVSTVQVYDPVLDSWCEVASMAMTRCAHGAAALDGKLYVMGGREVRDSTSGPPMGPPIAEAEVYDPEADDWQPLPNMLMSRYSLAAVAVGGKIYAIGGVSTDGGFDGGYCDAVEAYDPVSGAWTQVASLPMALCCHTATVVDGKIYVLGGDVEGAEFSATDRVDMYNPATDSWQQMTAMPTARGSHAAAVLDGKIYVTGGFTLDGKMSDVVEAYEPVADTWTTLALAQSEGFAWHASAAINGKLVEICVGLVRVYSPASNNWEYLADQRDHRHGPTAMDEAVAVAL